MSKLNIPNILKVFLDIAMIGMILAIVIETGFYVYAIINPEAEVDEAYIEVPCKVSALDIDVLGILFGDVDVRSISQPFLKSSDPANYKYNVRNTATKLRFRTSNSIYLILYYMIRMIWYAVFLFILFNLSRVFALFKQRSPFISETVFRLRRIGFAIIAAVPLIVFLLWIIDIGVIQDKFTILDKPVTVQLWSESIIPVLFTGMVILVISEIFKHGVRIKTDFEDLQQDQKLTV
ncbi:DUF2975 domain-containing protein [candidate division KSB1 bacterium]